MNAPKVGFLSWTTTVLTVIGASACGLRLPEPAMIPGGVASHDLPSNHHAMMPAFDDCPSGACGPNSSVVNTMPYNGLHPDGYLNADEVGLVKFSLNRADSECDRYGTDKLYLDVKDADLGTGSGYQLIAKNDKDQERCHGLELVGATFAVRWKKGTRSATLRISQMGFTTIYRTTSKRFVYLITPADQPANSLCTTGLPSRYAKATPILNRGAVRGQLAEIDSEELASYAIIIPGVVYGSDGMYIPESLKRIKGVNPDDFHMWFNIACASDGLAKTELSGLATAPITDSATAKARQPALHMFTAQYCAGISTTLRGTPIHWDKDVQSHVSTAGEGPVEAQWGEQGAICLWHSRLWIPNKTISLPPQLLGLWPTDAGPLTLGEEAFLAKVKHMCEQQRVPIPACEGPLQNGALTSYTMNHHEHQPGAATALAAPAVPATPTKSATAKPPSVH
jgi:hypothetical protein